MTSSELTAECPLCVGEGQPLYSGLSDRLFGSGGTWGFRQCVACGLVWSHPRPSAAELERAYANYYTHAGPGFAARFFRSPLKRALIGRISGASKQHGWFLKSLGAALTRIPLLRDLGLLGTMYLGNAKKGRLLDIGCGNGSFLALMREAGWEVAGVEPDPRAAAIAHNHYDLSTVVPSLETASFSPGSFDAITMNHVIEHSADPIQLLAECRRILRPGGKIVITTPNIDSLGHQLLRDAWVHLDPPRHLYIFSHHTLGQCCERAGLVVELQRSTFRNAAWTWRVGKAIRRHGKYSGQNGAATRLESWLFFGKELSLLRRSMYQGEELLTIATLPRQASNCSQLQSGSSTPDGQFH